MKDLLADFEVDILVVGGSMAGCAAAIKAKEALDRRFIAGTGVKNLISSRRGRSKSWSEIFVIETEFMPD
jgi:hypothetical protein